MTGIYYDYLTTGSGSSKNNDFIANLYSIITKYDTRFTRPDTNQLRFENNFTVASTGNYAVDGRGYLPDYTSCKIISVVTSKMYYVLFIRSSDDVILNGLCWLKEDDLYYFGGGQSGVIDGLGFTCKTSPYDNTNYSIKKHAQFRLASPNLLFIEASIMGDTNGNYKKLTELKSCSTVTFKDTVSIDGENYFAIGTNTLIKI